MKEPNWEECTEEEYWTYVAWHLAREGIESVLVGGAVVAIYTEGLYQSKDIDLVPEDGTQDRIDEVLKSLGFKATGRHHRHPACRHLFVEFPLGPVSLGEEFPITPGERIVDGQVLRLLTPTDCVKDRLASFIHWKVRDTFDQAVLVCRRQKEHVDLDQIAKWCKGEGDGEVYEKLVEALEQEE